MHWMNDDLDERRRRGLYRVRRRLQSAQGPHVRLHDSEFVNFSSNDYLNLAADPRLARAAARAARHYGCGAGASALVSGLLPPLRPWNERWPDGRGRRPPWFSAAASSPTWP